MALGSVQGRQLPPINTEPLKQLVQADVQATQLKHAEFMHFVDTPPMIEYPSLALVQNIFFDTETTQTSHPGAHGIID
jgi:hypothetical protein